MKKPHLIIGGIILVIIAFVIGRASKNGITTTTNGTNGSNGAGGRFASNANPALVGKWKQVPNLSTGACPEGSSSGKYLGEDPIGYNNGNPIYRCYISTANAS